MTTDKRRERRQVYSAAMKKSAESRRCPDCKKGNAMNQKRRPHRTAPEAQRMAFRAGAVCRYCGFSVVVDS